MASRYPLNLPVDLKQEAEQIAARQGISLNQLILWSLAEKVTELKHKLDDPKFPGITYRLSQDGSPVPVLRGMNLRVQTLVIANQAWKEPLAEIARQYELPERVVREALGFYQAHQRMVDALIKEEAALEGTVV
jgi:uncharacterized protein (DUF433 family)